MSNAIVNKRYHQNSASDEVCLFIISKIEEKLPFRDFLRFFKDKIYFERNNFSLNCISETKQHIELISKKYSSLIEQIINENWHEYKDNINLSFFYADENGNLINANEQENLTENVIYFDEINKQCTFNNFFHNNTNILAFKTMQSVCCAIFDEMISSESIVYLHSSAGNGKTHLMKAAYQYYLDNNGKAFYTSGISLVKEYVAAVQNNSTNELYNKILANDLILIDSIDDILGKKATMNFLITITKEAVLKNKHVVISSKNQLQNSLEKDERLKEIANSIIDISIQSPDNEIKRMIAINEIKQNNNNLSLLLIDDIISYLGENCREIRNTLKKILIEQSISKDELNSAQAKEILFNIGKIKQSPKDLTTLDSKEIIEKIACYYNININAIKGDSKTREISKARCIIMFVLSQYKHISYSEIGRLLNKNHSTVINSIKKVEQQINEDQAALKQILTLIETIKG
jgi:chromosomal replication initiator protein